MGKRGPQPQPTALRRLRGNPSKRPLPEGEPVAPEGAPRCPDFLQGEARAEWRRLCANLRAMNLLHRSDGVMMCQWCEAWATYSDAVKALQSEQALVKLDGVVKANPRMRIKDNAAARLVRLADRFGLAPSARTRITLVEDEQQEDPLFTLMQRRFMTQEPEADIA